MKISNYISNLLTGVNLLILTLEPMIYCMLLASSPVKGKGMIHQYLFL